MENNPISNEAMAGVYENLKRHEETIRDLKASVDSLMTFLHGSDAFGRLQAEKLRLLGLSEHEHADQIRLFDELIARLRSR
jgi:isopentenyl phosphate kinase